jgi:hypothetical protein
VKSGSYKIGAQHKSGKGKEEGKKKLGLHLNLNVCFCSSVDAREGKA